MHRHSRSDEMQDCLNMTERKNVYQQGPGMKIGHLPICPLIGATLKFRETKNIRDHLDIACLPATDVR